MTQFNKRWHSPIQTYTKLFQLAQSIGYDVFEQDYHYKKAQEAGTTAAVALVLTKIRNSPAFLRLPKNDPPDAYIMQPSPTQKGTMDITTLEITKYEGKQGTLLEQLKNSQKIPATYHKYGSEYILLIELHSGEGIDYSKINAYLKETGTPFAVWTMRKYADSPDTIVEVTVIDEDPTSIRYNIVQEADRMAHQSIKIPDIVISKRIGNIANVGISSFPPLDIAPWEDLED